MKTSSNSLGNPVSKTSEKVTLPLLNCLFIYVYNIYIYSVYNIGGIGTKTHENQRLVSEAEHGIRQSHTMLSLVSDVVDIPAYPVICLSYKALLMMLFVLTMVDKVETVADVVTLGADTRAFQNVTVGLSFVDSGN